VILLAKVTLPLKQSYRLCETGIFSQSLITNQQSVNRRARGVLRAAATGALDFRLRPLVALFGITTDADAGIAGIQAERRNEKDDVFHASGIPLRAGLEKEKLRVS
jgi:hypothetical protein